MDVPVATLHASVVSTSLLRLVSAGACGRVVSVHRSALNAELGGELVTVAPAAAGGLPSGILVADGFEPAVLGVQVGAPVIAGPRALRIGRSVYVGLEAGRRWSPRIPVRAPVWSGLADRVSRLDDLARAAAAGGRDGFGGVVAAAASPALAALRDAVDHVDLDAVAARGAALIGLGAGLTPAGADLLVGLAAALAGGGHAAAPRVAGDWAVWAVDRTTAVALGYHRHAARGAFAERLHRVVDAVLAGPAWAVDAAAQRAISAGATSGVDGLRGVVLGTRLLLAERARATGGTRAA